MFKKLDIYIIKKYLGTFFFTILLFTTVAIVLDYAEKTDNFTAHRASLKDIWSVYYFNLIPYLISMFIPLFSFIAVVFFTSKMAYGSEIVAILSSGVSFNRMLRPYFISAFVLAVIAFFLHNYIIPPANEKRLKFESVYVQPNNYRSYYRENIYRQVFPGVYVFIKNYYPEKKYGRNFVMEKYENSKLTSRLVAYKATWNDELHNWKLSGCRIRNIVNEKETMTSVPRIDTTFNLRPQELLERKEIVETMNFNELNHFIKDQAMKGTGNIDRYRMEKYRRLTNPIAIFILTVIGISLASRKIRGGIGLHIGLGLLISFTFVLFLRISSIFAANGIMSPLLAILSPSIFFAIVATFLYRYAPK